MKTWRNNGIEWFYSRFRRRQWHPTPVLLPGKSHGRMSLVGCSPWGRLESDTTERLHFHFSLSCLGEGNGTHSSVLAWRIPGTGEPGGLLSMGSHRIGHDWSDLAAAGKTTRPFKHDLNQIPYDYTVELRNRFKGLDLIECLMNYGRRFVTLYRRQGSRPSPWKRNAKEQNGCLRRPYK